MASSFLLFLEFTVFFTSLITVGAQSIRITPNETLYAQDGDSRTIVCSSDREAHDSLQWYNISGYQMTKTSRIIMSYFYTNKSLLVSLVFQPITTEDSSKYFCCSSSNVSVNINDTSCAAIDIIVSSGDRQPPRFFKDFVSYKFVEGEDVYLKCNATGYPTPEYEWIDNHGMNMHYRRGNWNVSIDGSLIIYSINASQEGNYTCIATNMYGNASKEYSIEVSRDQRPIFFEEFVSYEFVEGEDVYVTCSASGYPTPEYTWLDNRGRSMHNRSENWIASTNGTLRIYSINASQDGTYTCVAANMYGNATKLYLFVVNHGRVPIFREKYASYEFNEGDHVVLHCYAEGFPRPQYDWYDKYGRYLNDAYGNASSLGYLELYYIRSDQEGKYFCVASNIYGTATKEYDINVTRSENATLNVSLSEVWQTLVRFHIDIISNDVYRFILASYSNTADQTSWNSSTVRWEIGKEYLVTGLKPGSTYNFEFAVSKSQYEADSVWLEYPKLTVTLPPFSPLLIVSKVYDGTVEIIYPYQSFDELQGYLKPKYFVLQYVKLKQKSGSFYEDDCPITINISACSTGRKYVIGGLSSGEYYKIKLWSMLESGASKKSEVIIRSM